jgi:pimeloyl-ACP methyl ester carboxylesterase
MTLFSWSVAHAHPSEFFQQFNTEFMEVLSQTSPYMSQSHSPYPWWARVVQQESLKWVPTGQRQKSSEGCDPWVWQEKLEKAGGTASQFRVISQSYIDQCEVRFQGAWLNPIFQALKSLWIQFDARSYSMGRHVMFHLPNGVKLKGFLALKGDLKKRPLIILRSGIFSNTQEFFPERSMVIQLFEQSPFNLLMLESMSGSEFVSNNKAVSMVGFDEGLQNYSIVKKLSDPSFPLSKTVSTIHIVALSMGGHGAFYTSLLDSSQKHPPLLSSVLGYCPLVDHRSTADFHNAGGASKWMMNYFSARRLTSMKKIIPDLQDDQWVDGLTRHLETQYKMPLVGRPTDFLLPKISEEVLRDEKNPIPLFWRANDFWKAYRNIKIPVMVFANPKDPLVPFQINAQKLLDHRIDVRDSDLAVSVFPEGYHCSFPAAYDWSFVATLGQSFIFSTTKWDQRVTYQKEIPVTGHPAEEEFIQLEFSSQIGLSSLQVEAVQGDLKVRTDLPLVQMDYHLPSGFRSQDQILALTRWAHQNVRAQRSNDKIILSWKAWH